MLCFQRKALFVCFKYMGGSGRDNFTRSTNKGEIGIILSQYTLKKNMIMTVKSGFEIVEFRKKKQEKIIPVVGMPDIFMYPM